MRAPRQLTHAAVLKAADKLFRRKGFQAASIDDIARDARLTKGAIYSNFAGKDALFLAVLEQHVERTIARYQAVTQDGAEDPIAGLAAFLAQTAVEDAAWSAAFAEFALHASRRAETAQGLATVRGRLRTAVIERLRAIVDGGQADGERLERAATLFFAISNGLTLEALSDPSRVDASVYHDALERLLRP